MGYVNWTVVIVVALVCYTLYAIAALDLDAQQIKQEHTSEEDSDI